MIKRPAITFKAAFLTFLVAALAGCAGGANKEESGSDTVTKKALIQVTRNAQKSDGDCPVTVKISNRTNVAWDGVSYHLAMHNKNGVSVGKLMGSPRRSVKAGGDLMDSGQILGAKCEQVTGMALVYFGYYPAGKKQVSLHNANVQISLK
jgi:hypothetical protein